MWFFFKFHRVSRTRVWEQERKSHRIDFRYSLFSRASPSSIECANHREFWRKNMLADGMNKLRNCAQKINLICVNVRFCADKSRRHLNIGCCTRSSRRQCRRFRSIVFRRVRTNLMMYCTKFHHWRFFLTETKWNIWI